MGYGADARQGEEGLRQDPAKNQQQGPDLLLEAPLQGRNLVESFFNKIKFFRRIATIHDKRAQSFLGFVQIATIGCWIRFLQTT
jgi:hypothetical protein